MQQLSLLDIVGSTIAAGLLTWGIAAAISWFITKAREPDEDDDSLRG